MQLQNVTNSGRDDEAKRRAATVLVLFPYGQTFLPEFEAFGLMEHFNAVFLTNSSDIIDKLPIEYTVVDPELTLLPLGSLLTYKFCYSRNLDRLLERYSPVAVITFELYSTLSFQVSRRKKQFGFSHVVVCYETVPVNRSLWGLFPATRLMGWYVAGKSDLVVGLSRRIADSLIASGVDKEKLAISYPGVNVPSRIPKIPRHTEKEFRIIYLGRLRENKGIRTLLRAFRLLMEQGRNDIRLIIAGDGPLEQEVSAAARNTPGLTFVGFVYGALKEKLMLESDLFVYPSEDIIYFSKFKRWEEQTAAAVREAMALGLPAVVSDSGSLPELIGRDDVVFKQGDHFGLTKRILSVLTSEALRNELQSFNYDRCASQFEMSRFSKFIEEQIVRLDI